MKIDLYRGYDAVPPNGLPFRFEKAISKPRYLAHILGDYFGHHEAIVAQIVPYSTGKSTMESVPRERMTNSVVCLEWFNFVIACMDKLIDGGALNYRSNK